MIKWKPFTYENITYDLTHLHPKIILYNQITTPQKKESFYNVQIIYSLHCFTRKKLSDEPENKLLFYKDSRETRLFDFTRYELSKQLPSIVENLNLKKCYHTGKGNFFVVELINHEGKKEEYEVYFEASRSSTRGVINLYVQSAYARDKKHASARPKKKPIRFEIILFNISNNKIIRIQK